jgi:hypothetical protein
MRLLLLRRLCSRDHQDGTRFAPVNDGDRFTSVKGGSYRDSHRLVTVSSSFGRSRPLFLLLSAERCARTLQTGQAASLPRRVWPSSCAPRQAPDAQQASTLPVVSGSSARLPLQAKPHQPSRSARASFDAQRGLWPRSPNGQCGDSQHPHKHDRKRLFDSTLPLLWTRCRDAGGDSARTPHPALLAIPFLSGCFRRRTHRLSCRAEALSPPTCRKQPSLLLKRTIALSRGDSNTASRGNGT